MTIAVGNQKLVAVRGDLPEGTTNVFVSIRAEDIVLVKADTIKTSARNALPGIVCGLATEGPMIRVDLDCGLPLIAFLTKPAIEDLQLKKGDSVLALIKAPNVNLIARDT